MDNVFMGIVLGNNKEAVEFVLRTILGSGSLKVHAYHAEETIHNLFGRGVRLDVYCEGSDGRCYDIEIQRSSKGAIPKRARYNASLVDSKSVHSGTPYENFPEVFIIFITETDIFQEGRPLYHVERIISESSLPFNDEQHIIYVNSTNTDDTPLGWLMHDFKQSNPKSMHYPILKNAVTYYKDTKKGREEMSDIFEEIREEGRQEGRETGIQDERINVITSMLAKGITADEISRLCNFPTSLVNEVAATQTIPAAG